MKVGDLVRIKGAVLGLGGERPLGVLVKEWEKAGWWNVLVNGQMIAWPENSMELVSESR